MYLHFVFVLIQFKISVNFNEGTIIITLLCFHKVKEQIVVIWICERGTDDGLLRKSSDKYSSIQNIFCFVLFIFLSTKIHFFKDLEVCNCVIKS